MKNSKKNLLLFAGLLIFAGILHIIEHTIHDISALDGICDIHVAYHFLDTVGIYQTAPIQSKKLYGCSGSIHDFLSDTACI